MKRMNTSLPLFFFLTTSLFLLSTFCIYDVAAFGITMDDNNTAANNTDAATDTVDSDVKEEAVETPAEATPEATTAATASSTTTKEETAATPQTGPLVDLFGPTLLSLEMVDETHAKLDTHLTNDALGNKKVIGLYFSADWCGPCRQFTPELVNFYNKMNSRKGQKDGGNFEIVWISRCRDTKSFGQYFTQMGNWYALPPEEASGPRGQMLGTKFKTQGIPHLVLIDETGSVITLDARNKIPQDKAGIGFPWRNPFMTLYITLVPKAARLVVNSYVDVVKGKVDLAVGDVVRKTKEKGSGVLSKLEKLGKK